MLAVVILTDNDPMARVLSVAIVTFLAGMFMLRAQSQRSPPPAALSSATLIALWETHAPADPLVKRCSTCSAPLASPSLSVVAVEYIFGSRHPAEELQQQRLIRYEALETMFSLYAQGRTPHRSLRPSSASHVSPPPDRSRCSELYNTIVDRNLDTGTLPIGTRVRITMLAQLMDVSAAFGSQYPAALRSCFRQRCAHIAELCR